MREDKNVPRETVSLKNVEKFELYLKISHELSQANHFKARSATFPMSIIGSNVSSSHCSETGLCIVSRGSRAVLPTPGGPTIASITGGGKSCLVSFDASHALLFCPPSHTARVDVRASAKVRKTVRFASARRSSSTVGATFGYPWLPPEFWYLV